VFFNRASQARPAVKKVGELVNFKAHKQKKYISLMLVPSYSGAKTRSVHIPRTLFFGTFLFFLLLASSILGFHLRAIHFENLTHTLAYTLEETIENFYEYRITAGDLHTYLLDNSADVYARLGQEQHRARAEMWQQESRHLGDFEYVQSALHELERQIALFETERKQTLETLTRRAGFIPPIANTVRYLVQSQEILAGELFESPPLPSVLGARTPSSDAELFARIASLTEKFENQQLLLANILEYKAKMEQHLRTYPTLNPLPGRGITSGFGTRRDPITGRQAFHTGVDIPAPTGTPILAAGGGTVVFSGWRGGYGNVIFICHGGDLQTRYAHNSRNLVFEGDIVQRGQTIAYVGSTGRSISPHLHYEVLRGGSHINPVPFMNE